MNVFAVKFKAIISIASIKLTALSKHLSYDISYLSKWASGKSLPAKSNIDVIARNFADFVLLNCSETDYANLIEYLGLTNPDTFEVKATIKKTLVDAYYECIETTSNGPTSKKMHFLPAHLGSNLFVSLEKVLLEKNEIRYLSMCAAFSMSDKYSYYHVAKKFADLDTDQKIHSQLLLSFNDFESDIIGNFTMLINMALALRNHHTEFFLSSDPIYTELNIISGHKAIVSNYFDTRKYLCTFDVNDKEEVNRIYLACQKLCGDRYKKFIYNCNGTPKTYSNFYAGSKFAHLHYVFTELFMTKEIFMKHIPSEEFIPYYNEIKIALSFPSLIMIGKETIFQFLRTGQLFLFDSMITLTPEERIRYLNNLVRTLSNNPGITAQIVGRVDELSPYDMLPIAYSFSRSYTLVRAIPVNNPAPTALLFNDKKMNTALMTKMELMQNCDTFVYMSSTEEVVNYLKFIIAEYEEDIEE